MWNTLWDELREMVWLAAVIGGLSVLGVGHSDNRIKSTQYRQESVLGRLGKVLRGRDDDITNEPLPRRWVDLIHHLDDKERTRREPRATLEKTEGSPPTARVSLGLSESGSGKTGKCESPCERSNAQQGPSGIPARRG